jgi:Rps23 Pro-64 3,4-dihydroxylase Tpa1-like proline 4-hydroxylase
MITTHRTTSTGENLWIYDNVFTQDELEFFKMFAQNSHYTLGAKSNYSHESSSTFFTCELNEVDLLRFGLYQSPNLNEINKHLENKIRRKTWILHSSHLSKHFFHVDKLKTQKSITFLFYVNTKWDVDWGGETLFCNSHGEVELAVSCKPNRVVVYDSHIPHKPSTVSHDATPHRFTFVSQFTEE